MLQTKLRQMKLRQMKWIVGLSLTLNALLLLTLVLLVVSIR